LDRRPHETKETIMNNVISLFGKSIALTLALAAAPCAYSTTACAEAAAPAAVRPDLKQVETHLEKHQTYPATRAELLASCKNLSEFNDGEKAWFAAHLPEGTYKSSTDVMKALRK
jgi:hypothetical protein